MADIDDRLLSHIFMEAKQMTVLTDHTKITKILNTFPDKLLYFVLIWNSLSCSLLQTTSFLQFRAH